MQCFNGDVNEMDDVSGMVLRNFLVLLMNYYLGNAFVARSRQMFRRVD